MNNPHKDTIALESYNKMAQYYGEFVDTKPWNAYYERPATLSLLPDVKNKKILDLGCAGGWFTNYLLEKDADVIAIDVNKNMVEKTKERVNNKCPVIQADINNGFDFIENCTFDIVLASLVLHYINNLEKAFSEINRILKINGLLIFSTHHPLMEFVHFQRENYMDKELLNDEWDMDGKRIKIQFYRRPLSKLLQPLINNGFYIENILEPEPTEEFKKQLPDAYEKVIKRPNFLVVKAKKT